LEDDAEEPWTCIMEGAGFRNAKWELIRVGEVD